MSIATSPSKHVKERVAALEEAPLAVSYHDENLPEVLRILGDENEPTKVRLAALQALQTASFNAVAFAPVRGEYMATLRKVAKDPDPELRENAAFIQEVVASEEERFAATLRQGMVLFDGARTQAVDGVVRGEDAFKLSDTFGFPVELTVELAADEGLTVDEERFRELLQ